MSSPKVALITGGTKGIGQATALRLASKGYNLALNYSSSPEAFEETKSQIQAAYKDVKVIGIQADLAQAGSNKMVIDTVVKEFGKIDVLILNAGVMPTGPFLQATEEDLDRTTALNYKSPFLMTQAAVPHIPKGGRIIFLSTSLCTASTISEPYVLYCPTKGAIEQLARILAKSLGTPEYDIRVNTVAPGPTASDLFLKGKPDQMIAGIAGAHPQNRLGEPKEIADVMAFLVSEEANWVNGQILRVNGGMVV